MYVRALNKFNHGGIVEFEYGESKKLDDTLAKKLIDIGLVIEVVESHKKIKIKKDVVKPIDEAADQAS